MQTTLVNLRDRLSDLSKRNRSLRLLRLYDKWNFDLAQLDKLKDVKRATTEQLCKKLISVSGSIFLVESNSDNESAAKASHRLASLFRNLNAIEEETGTYSLFVGYPFLKGTLIDGTYIQAPVFLFPVRLERITAKTLGWSLSINSKEEVIPNRTLLLAFQKYNQMKIDEEIYEEARAIPKEGFESWVSDLLNRYGVKCHPLSKEVLPLTQYSQKEIPSMRPGLLAIVSHMILGHFPQGNTALIRGCFYFLDMK